jgi:hypothetical protein
MGDISIFNPVQHLGGDDGADDLTDLSALYLVLRANPHNWL